MDRGTISERDLLTMATKKEIDKDLMYKKIMPTGTRTGKSAARDAQSLAMEAILPESNPPAPASEAKAQSDTAPEGSYPIAPGKNTIFRTNPELQFHTVDHSVLINLMERLVAQRLDEAFAKFNCCKCDKCKKDAAALALNRLTPKYVVAAEDQIVELASRQTQAEVLTAIVQAILVVKAHPDH